MRRYNPKEIEPKWQAKWAELGIYTANLKSAKQKFIGFGMFNYPSGAGIHIGHAKNFTIPDVVTRARRQQGFESYSPVGWDSFGLPAENYAIKTGTPPRETIDKAIINYKKQYRAMGWGQDWTKEIDTSDPAYYKWTQWIFNRFFENGLAYQKDSLQWWCPFDKTVLANEQVENGRCWRCGHEVEKKQLKQWFLKITSYADEILEATDELNWTESVKTMQKKWIGKSVGAEIEFKIPEISESVKVFTTRADTLFGATFLVLAPEHPLVEKVTSENLKEEVDKYVGEAVRKSEIQRMETDRDKTGVFTGSYALNPVNDAKIPIWVADYVLMGYGTGAIMAVPAHDERDNEFAKKYELPILAVVETGDGSLTGEGKLINSGEYNGLSTYEAREKIVVDLVKNKLAEESTQYKLHDWLISRQRYWGAPIPIIHCPEHGAVAVPDDQLPVVLPDVAEFAPTGGETSVLASVPEWVNTTCPKCNKPAKRETDTMDGYACSSWYFLRYIDPHNETKAWDEELANKWMPVDFYNGGDHATAHLLYARFAMRFFNKQGLVNTPEPFKKMYYHAKIVAADGTAFSKSKSNGPDPLAIIDSGYGADSLRTYILFMAPADMESPWNENGVPGCYRFLNRLWTITQEFLENSTGTESPVSPHTLNNELAKAAHRTIKKVTKDIEEIKFNTAIAAMMEGLNKLYKVNAVDGFADDQGWRFAVESFVQLVAPFAPHIAEELWHDLGHSDSVHVDHWPQWDEQYLTTEIMRIAVQVNGKVRAELDLPSSVEEKDAISAALDDHKIKAHIKDNQVTKTIYIPGRLVSIVTE